MHLVDNTKEFTPGAIMFAFVPVLYTGNLRVAEFFGNGIGQFQYSIYV